MLEGPESPKSPHKLVLPKNVADSKIPLVFLCERGSVCANLVNVTLPPPPNPRGANCHIYCSSNIVAYFFIFFYIILYYWVFRAFLTIHVLTWSSKLNFKVLKQLKQIFHMWLCSIIVIFAVSGAFAPLTQKWPEHFCFWLPEKIFGVFLLLGW